MIRLYGNYRSGAQSDLDDSAEQFAETVEQVDVAMNAAAQLFTKNDAEVAQLQQENDQQLTNISAAAPQLQLLASIRK